MSNPLERYNEDYAKAKAEKNNEIPDGTYTMKVTAAEVKTTKDSGKPMLVWEFEITDGEFAGRKEWKNAVIQDNTVGYIKSDLETAGLELAQFSDLYNRAGELAGLCFEVAIKTGKYRNIYINKLISAGAGAASAGTQADGDFDPFAA